MSFLGAAAQEGANFQHCTGAPRPNGAMQSKYTFYGMNIRRSFFLDCSPCVISNDKAGPTMKAETNYNTDYSKNALFEKRAKLYSRHSRILELSPLSKGRGRGDWFGSFKSEMNDN